MAIEFECPKCGRSYKVSEEKAGKRFACKQCGKYIEVPPSALPEGVLLRGFDKPLGGMRLASEDQVQSRVGQVSPRKITLPHRATLLIVLAVLGWVLCPAISPVNWWWARRDIREMEEGRMDPTGLPLVTPAYWLSLIHSILVGVTLVGVLVFVAIPMAVFLQSDEPDRAKWTRAVVDMGEIQKALNRWALEHDMEYPTELAPLQQQYFPGGMPKNPFDERGFIYERTNTGFTLTCLGRDRVGGGDSVPDKDIVFTEAGLEGDR